MWDRDRVKEQMTKIIAEQPDGSTNDKVLRELAFASMVEQGLKDSENNNTISNEELLHGTNKINTTIVV
jgi:hypothetical protein